MHNHRRTWIGWLLCFSAGSVLVVVLRMPASPQQAAPTALTGRFAPATAQVITSAAVGSLFGDAAPLHLDTRPGSLGPAAADALHAPLEDALHYVQNRTGMRLAAPMTVVFDRHVGSCRFDGMALTTQRTVVLYACPDVPRQRAVNILAHEFVHQLAHDHYGDDHLTADLILREGLATWGAGRFWLGSEPDFRHFVAHNYRAQLLPLDTDYASTPQTDAMNRLYYEWAAFVEWILETNGRTAFDRLYRGHGNVAGSAPYTAVLSLDLQQAERQWIAWLDQTP